METAVRTLVIATRNLHKAAEIRAVLGEAHVYATLADLPGAPGIVEDNPTFAGNATKKAVELARWLAAIFGTEDRTLETPKPRFEIPVCVLADDSGLEVDALGGAPGVRSARFAAEEGGSGNRPDIENNAKLLRLLRDVPAGSRTGRFRCVLALTPVSQDSLRNASQVRAASEFESQTQLFEGICEGRIGFAPRGNSGFGYDPLFVPEGYDRTFAELGEALKNRISHRSQALWRLRAALEQDAKDTSA